MVGWSFSSLKSEGTLCRFKSGCCDDFVREGVGAVVYRFIVVGNLAYTHALWGCL